MDRYTGPTEEPEGAASRRWCNPTACTATCTSSEEIFRLEQEHFFANTWIYVGHDSQMPKAGDYLTVDIGNRPLIVVRQPDGGVRGADEPLRAQGLAAGVAGLRQHRQVLPLPVPRLDLPHRRLAARHPGEGGLRRHRDARMRVRPGPGRRAERARVPRLRVRQAQRRRPRLRGVLRRFAVQHRQHGRPLARGRAGDRRRLPALPAQLQLEDVRREPERHHAPDGGARVLGRHREEDVEGQARRRAQADGHRAVRALHVRLPVLRRHGRARVRQRAQLLRRASSASTASTPACRPTRRRWSPPTASSARTTSWG